jgi:acyl dehydratase
MNERVQFQLEALGRWTPDSSRLVDAGAIRAYAGATGDRSRAVADGTVAPPVFAIVPAWEPLQETAREIAPAAVRPYVVHGEQDIVLHAPIEAGMQLRTRAAAIGVHPKGSGTAVVLKTETRNGSGRLLNEQYVTEFYRGVSATSGGGESAPVRDGAVAPAKPPEAEVSYPVAPDQTYRYAEASGDRNAIHLDDVAARAAGLPGIIVHGLCLMAFAGRAVLETQGNGDPAGLRRFAVRFSRPMRPGGELTTRIGRAGTDGAFVFDAVDQAGTVVLKDGWAELRR